MEKEMAHNPLTDLAVITGLTHNPIKRKMDTQLTKEQESFLML